MTSARCRSYRYLLQPTARQKVVLDGLLRRQCELYNAALEERRGAWKWERRSVSYVDQCRTLTDVREVRPEIVAQGITVCRGTLRRLDKSFGAFFRRCRAGDSPGYPRFKSVARWDSVQWEDRNGWAFEEQRRRLHLHGLGDIKMRLHRHHRGTPKAITVAREGRRWWVTVRCVDVPPEPLPRIGRAVGVDVGVCALVATSDGAFVTDGRYAQKAAQRLTAAQQNLARKQRGSHRRKRAVERVAAAHRKVRQQRTDHAHKVSRSLVNDYDLIVHENLTIATMVRRAKPRPGPAGPDGLTPVEDLLGPPPLRAPSFRSESNGTPKHYLPNGVAAKSGLNRSIHDAGWGQLLQFIAYKAESAGREVVAVDPRHTSQRCAQCGHVDKANRVSQAVFRCTSCGHEAHADTNAAVNILEAGRALRASACAAST